MGLCTESIATECVMLEASKTGRREEGSWAERGGLLGGERRTPRGSTGGGDFKVFVGTAPEACTASADKGHLEFRSVIRSISDVSASWCG